MAKKMALPKIGVNMTEAVIVKWLVRVGDKVNDGDALIEAETDKSTQEIYATDSGVVAKLLFGEGDTVQCHQDILVLVDEGEKYSGDAPLPVVQQEPEQLQKADTRLRNVPTKPVLAQGDRIKISPLAKKMAKEIGIDIQMLSPATPGSRIVKADILAFKPQDTQAQVIAELPAGEYLQRIAMSPMRRAIASRMSESNLQKPCAALTTTAGAEALLALRERYRQRGIPLSIDAILVKIAGRALSLHRNINTVLKGNEILVKRDINVGVAVDTPKGLMVPVIQNADSKTLAEIGENLAVLAVEARESRIAGKDIRGGTFTITNLGMFDIEQFTPVINPPECCILAIGAIKKVFAADENDQPVLKKAFQMTLVFDHRIVDGAPAAKFLKDFKEFVENPELLI